VATRRGLRPGEAWDVGAQVAGSHGRGWKGGWKSLLFASLFRSKKNTNLVTTTKEMWKTLFKSLQNLKSNSERLPSRRHR
jgi:hypothetical protein